MPRNRDAKFRGEARVRRYRVLRKSVIAAVLILLAAVPASAYVDPGSASFFVQVLIGTLLGIAFTVRLYWQKIKAYFKRGGRGPDAAP